MLIFVFLRISGTEHFLMYMLVFYITPFEKFIICYFHIGFLVLLTHSGYQPLFSYILCKYFLFTLLTISFAMQPFSDMISFDYFCLYLLWF